MEATIDVEYEYGYKVYLDKTHDVYVVLCDKDPKVKEDRYEMKFDYILSDNYSMKVKNLTKKSMIEIICDCINCENEEDGDIWLTDFDKATEVVMEHL